MKWWSESAPPLALRVTTKASDIIRDDVATLELTLKPHSSDGIILWNRGLSWERDFYFCGTEVCPGSEIFAVCHHQCSL